MGVLDKFYDEVKNWYIFSISDMDSNMSLDTAVYLFLRDHPDWSLSYYGEDIETGDDLYVLHDRNQDY